MSKFKPGDKFGFVTLKERFRMTCGNGTKGREHWKCICCCGREIIRREDYLHEGKAVNCGCKTSEVNNPGDKSKKWKGCGELSGQYFSEVRCSSANRDIPFAITVEQAWEKFVEQNHRCALTGLPLKMYTHRERKMGLQQTASLDRIDSLGGYTIDNIQWLHRVVNIMKNGFEQNEFIYFCIMIVANFVSTAGQVGTDIALDTKISDLINLRATSNVQFNKHTVVEADYAI